MNPIFCQEQCPKVSVIIPCFNYGKYLEEAIDSVLCSTFQNFEIIIVDDGSTDLNTCSLLPTLQKAKTRIIYQKDNKGVSISRNVGILASQGEYILTLDADDTIHPTMIEKSVNLLDSDPSIGFVYTLVRQIGESNDVWPHHDYNFYDLLFMNFISSCSMFRKEAWSSTGGYKNIGYQDWELWIAIGRRGWLGKCIEEELFYYRKHGISAMSIAAETHNMLILQIRELHKDLYGEESLGKIMQKWKQKPRVSVIMACFYFDEYIEASIDSILQSSFKDVEIILVVDLSTNDYTLSILKNIHKQRTRIMYIRKEGYVAARSAGIQAAQGDYILLLDAGNTVEPAMIERCINILDADPCVGFAYTGFQFIEKPGSYSFAPFDEERLLFENYIPQIALIKKDAYNRSERYDKDVTSLYPEWNLWLSIIEKGFIGVGVAERFSNIRKGAYIHEKNILRKYRGFNARLHERRLKLLLTKKISIFIKSVNNFLR